MECLRYLHEQGCPWIWQASASAAYAGHLDCLRYLYENDSEWNDLVTLYAAEGGHLDCLHYLHENGCPYDLKDLFSGLNKHTNKIDFDTHVWLREFLFPHVHAHAHANDMPLKLKETCKAKIAQIELVKQVVTTELTDKLSLDVVKHCVVVFI